MILLSIVTAIWVTMAGIGRRLFRYSPNARIAWFSHGIVGFVIIYVWLKYLGPAIAGVILIMVLFVLAWLVTTRTRST
jgi:energy-converting hydrogenase Eha subunit C